MLTKPTAYTLLTFHFLFCFRRLDKAPILQNILPTFEKGHPVIHKKGRKVMIVKKGT